MRLGSLLLCAAALAGCGDDPPYELRGDDVDICASLVDACQPGTVSEPTISDWVTVVPDAEAMPAGVESQLSHNNLDIAWHKGRLFFAFRTAPSHFASEETWLYIVSTEDQKEWVLEASFNMLTDLREPRFLSRDGELFFYFAVLGYNPTAFEPQMAMMSNYLGPADWSEPVQVLDDGFIPWRARTVDGTSYLIGYIGGENIYELDGEPIQVHFLTTEDGASFQPVVEGKPVVFEGGTSETDFAFRPDGSLIAVGRNEAGDEDGFGSKICRAEPGALADWSCADDPKKYDSPLVFSHDGEIWLVGRRHISDTGNYDLGRDDLSIQEQSSLYNRDYWTKPKRCALWKVDGDALAVEHVLDLPSNGDTCFASVVPLGDGQFLLYNYTSPLDDPDLKWVEGQTGPTLIYRLTLQLP